VLLRGVRAPAPAAVPSATTEVVAEET